MPGEIIENVFHPDIDLSRRKRPLLPDWTKLSAKTSVDSQCECTSVTCISLIDFCMMIGIITLGMVMSLAMVYAAVLVRVILKMVLTINFNSNQVLDNDEDNYSGINLLDELVL